MAAQLPFPVLCHIFALACSEGSLPTAAYLPCVSRHWREAAKLCEPALWACADLSFGWARTTNAVLARLASRGCFRATRRLCLAGCDRLSDASLELLTRAVLQGQLAELVSLDVSGCKGFSSSALAQFIVALPSLTALHLQRSALKLEHLREVFAAKRDTLQSVSLAHCPRFCSSTLRCLLQLAALRSLTLTGAGVHAVSVPIELMQAAMPRLAELRLAALGSSAGWSAPASGRPESGFKHLRVLHVGPATRLTQQGAITSSSCVCDGVLARLTRDAAALRELSVPGTRVTARGLDALLTDGLHLLHVSGSACCTDAGAEVAARRWQHTLVAAEFAGPAVSDEGVHQLAACTHLTSLDIASSSVTAAGLRALLLAECTMPPLLTDLTLSSCRHLDRSIRQAGLAGVNALREALRNGALALG